MTAELPAQGPLGEHVRAIRQQLDMTQVAFADYCGVTQPQVSAWERGDDLPNKGVAWMLHERHGLPLDAYFAGSSRRTAWFVGAPLDQHLQPWAMTADHPLTAAA